MHVADHGHFPLRSEGHASQLLRCQVCIEPFDERLNLLALLQTDHDKVVVLWIGNQLIEALILRFPCHIPSHAQHIDILWLPGQLIIDRL